MNRMLQQLAGLIFMVILGVPFSAHANNQPFQEVVRKSFAENPVGPGFFMKSTKGKNHVEVCGDSCAYFEWQGELNDERFWRFIVLYELNDGPGTDVAAFSPNVKALNSHDLIESNYCSTKGADLSTVDCDWTSYSMSLKMTVGHSKYDEGQRCYANGLGRDWAVIRTLKWKCSPMKPKESPFK
jgi:hypothetical protein